MSGYLEPSVIVIVFKAGAALNTQFSVIINQYE